MDYTTVEASLAKVRARMERELASVPETDWARKPASGGWSVAEVVAHLMQVEAAIETAGTKALQSPPRPLRKGLLPRRVWPPIWLVPYRGLKRESPIPMDPALVRSKAEMLEQFAARRKSTLAFLQQAMASDAAMQCNWRHPFFGFLTLGEWCRLIGYHETRHTKQIREIVSSFQS